MEFGHLTLFCIAHILIQEMECQLIMRLSLLFGKVPLVLLQKSFKEYLLSDAIDLIEPNRVILVF